MRILIIEDDLDLSATLGDYLEVVGHEADFAYDGHAGTRIASTSSFDGIVLDLGLPGIDGLEVCRRIRAGQKGSVPILILTARDLLEDKLAGFAAGADDYLLKPFEMQELVVRLEALQRRARGTHDSGIIQVADLVIEPKLGRISRAGDVIELHRIGVELLTILARESPRLVPRDEIEQRIWGGESPDRDLLRSHLYLVRQVVDRPYGVPLIQTVRGRGLRLVDPSQLTPLDPGE
jgi:DNA-binding response OmpR family regulator